MQYSAINLQRSNKTIRTTRGRSKKPYGTDTLLKNISINLKRNVVIFMVRAYTANDAGVKIICLRRLPQLDGSILVPKSRISADRGRETGTTLFSRGREPRIVIQFSRRTTTRRVACIFDGAAENHVASSTRNYRYSPMDPRKIGSRWIPRCLRWPCELFLFLPRSSFVTLKAERF